MMKKEEGETDFLPYITEDESNIFNGDHAMKEICKYLVKGEVPKKDMQV